MKQLAIVDRGAEFDQTRIYRYRLWRRWAEGPMLMVIGLNPSTADESQDDPTIRRCIGYAKLWGFAGIRMLNVFGYRATDPKALRQFETEMYQNRKVGDAADPYYRHQVMNMKAISEDADRTVLEEGGALLCAWGSHAVLRVNRLDHVKMVRGALHGIERRVDQVPAACLGMNRDGNPKHPLYVAANVVPVGYIGNGGILCDPEFRRKWDMSMRGDD